MNLELNDNTGKVLGRTGEAPAAQFARPKTRALWATLVILVATLVATAGYGYHLLKRDHIPLGQLPEMLQSIATLDGRMGAVESNLRTWSTDWGRLVERVGRLERRTNTNLALTRKHAEHLTAELEERLKEQMDARAYLVDNRLSRLESAEESQHQQLARLQEAVARVRQEVAAERQETGRNVATLHEQIRENERETSAVAQKLERRRVDFEAARNRTYELAQGISLHVTRTDILYQRYGGWVALTPEGRTLWVEKQGVDRPLVFYPAQNGEKCELVVTRVARDSVVGFLSLPADQGESARSPVADLATAPVGTR